MDFPEALGIMVWRGGDGQVGKRGTLPGKVSGEATWPGLDPEAAEPLKVTSSSRCTRAPRREAPGPRVWGFRVGSWERNTWKEGPHLPGDPATGRDDPQPHWQTRPLGDVWLPLSVLLGRRH